MSLHTRGWVGGGTGSTQRSLRGSSDVYEAQRARARRFAAAVLRCACAPGPTTHASRPNPPPRSSAPAAARQHHAAAGQLLEARAPLQGLMLANKFGRPAQVARVPVAYVPAGDKRLQRLRPFSHSPVTWFRNPYVHVILVRAANGGREGPQALAVCGARGIGPGRGWHRRRRLVVVYAQSREQGESGANGGRRFGGGWGARRRNAGRRCKGRASSGGAAWRTTPSPLRQAKQTQNKRKTNKNKQSKGLHRRCQRVQGRHARRRQKGDARRGARLGRPRRRRRVGGAVRAPL